MAEDLTDAARMAAVAAGTGAVARVILALQGGERSPVVLCIQAGFGATLGVIAAAAVVYFDPALRHDGWPVLIVGGAAGFAGALGNRLLDMLAAAAQRRIG